MLPQDLAGFRNLHHDETVFVCGCGASLSEFHCFEGLITIGVNDVGRRFDPTYLVVLNPRQQFNDNRFRYVEQSRARALFTQLDLGIPHPHIVRFKLGERGGTDLSDPNVLPYTRNSPYVALCLALHMGAKRIGLIGVDFTDHHFFAQTGRHPLISQLAQIGQEYACLAEVCARSGVEVVNLSGQSRLTAFPKRSLEAFTAESTRIPQASEATRALHIVSYATTPVAGVPAILARCITARTLHRGRCVWAHAGYDNGVEFQGDIQWTESSTEARKCLEEADVVIVHNGKVDSRHRALLANKAIVTLAHNYMWNVDQSYVKQAFPGMVVGQYQAVLPEFAGWQPVPNPIPFWEDAYQPGPKADMMTIAYTPSGKHERYPQGHRLYWHAKGYETTLRVLERLSARYSLRLEVIGDRQVSHAESLAMKQRAHIVIDECVTGSYHRNSLEGLAMGCVVVNGVGLLPGVPEVFRQCANGADDIPFVHADLASLEAVLASLIESGREALTQQGKCNREWLEQHWDFAQQWQEFWQPAVERALMVRGTSGIAEQPRTVRSVGLESLSADPAPITRTRGSVSVILPHGGEERLPHLTASLINLRNTREIAEVIVVELGESPVAVEVSRRLANKYVFVHHQGLFERARALNIGVGLAAQDLLLWMDNDLLITEEFVNKAALELRKRQLDFLIPYTAIRYLSESDTQSIMEGVQNSTKCTPVRVFRSGRDVSGGAGLVRKQFVLDHGGMDEGFRGWGGEDNAWIHKVSLFGNWAVTSRSDQFLYHLYHPGSGGNGDGAAMAGNPCYTENLSRLHRLRQINNRAQFLKAFPRPAYLTCPWNRNRGILFVTESAISTLDGLVRGIIESYMRQYGITVEHQRGLAEVRPFPDALVVFGTGTALTLLSQEALDPLFPRTIAVCDSISGLSSHELRRLGLAGAIVTFGDAERERVLRQAGLEYWTLEHRLEDTGSYIKAAQDLLQPLSLMIAEVARGVRRRQGDCVIKGEAVSTKLPVWLYWEGECPAWIEACRQTIQAHTKNLRLLEPNDFNILRHRDRDIDLSRLQVAHRADFIRVYLLAHYGGLWIDSDCLVMQSLDSILAILNQTEFLAHRERSGEISNGFIGAPPGSRITAEYYQRVCQILRSGRRLGWVSIGSEPLTQILNTTRFDWHELPCEQIQPICWRDSRVFFQSGTSEEHERHIDRQAVCYMLSNHAITQYRQSHPRCGDLLDNGTFFSYLLARALAPQRSLPLDLDRTMVRREWSQIPFTVQALVDIAPRRVLDVGVGFGRWGLLLREFCEPSTVKTADDWTIHLEGITSSDKDGFEHLRSLYNCLHCSDIWEWLLSNQERWNVMIFSELTVQPSQVSSYEMLDRALDMADYVVLPQGAMSERDHSAIPWDSEDVSLPQNAHWHYWMSQSVCRSSDHTGTDKAASGSFVLSKMDPKGLRPLVPFEQTFTKILNNYRRFHDESLSGPGSCLAQTREIRQQLPLLIAELKIQQLLDAPCGDFNWMQQVDLGVEHYIGVDVISELVQQNQVKYGSEQRRFIQADITRDLLPAADLILCRDCLVHFPTTEIFRTLRNFKRSGATYLLTTTFSERRPNREVALGDWRPLNLQLPPIDLPAPLRFLNEKCTENRGVYADKALGLWKLDELPFI